MNEQRHITQSNIDRMTFSCRITALTLAHEQEKCVIVVTHSKELAEEADEVILLKNGKMGKF